MCVCGMCIGVFAGACSFGEQGFAVLTPRLLFQTIEDMLTVALANGWAVDAWSASQFATEMKGQVDASILRHVLQAYGEPVDTKMDVDGDGAADGDVYKLHPTWFCVVLAEGLFYDKKR
jgi:hypothetical protein